MNFLYLDIETIPAQSPDVRARIAENVTPPANMKKAETIAAWEANDKPAAVEAAIDKTALDGAYGHICCIGWAFNDDRPVTSSMTHYSKTEETEALVQFVEMVEAKSYGSMSPPVIVGHNVAGFDLRFIWQRAMVLGVRLPIWFPRDPKPWSGEVFDTMTAFAGARDYVSLDKLCQAFGIAGKQGVDGSMVGQMWAEGKYLEIAEYCKDDVNKVRRAHKQMQRAFGEAA